MKRAAATPLARTRRAVRARHDPARAFAALGDATRLRLVTRLAADGPLSIVRLTQEAALSRQAISKHLRVLEQGGLVHSRREGRERLWELQAQRLSEVRDCLDRISGQWDAAIGRLRTLVEAPDP